LLKDKIHSTFDGAQPGKSLAGLCLKLLADQKETWPVLREGYEAQRQVRERSIPCSGFAVLLQHNPGRIISTLAAVGEQDTNERPCFLCLHHLPEGQKGVLYRDEYLILSNPMPVFSAHFTIAHVDHRPQSISGHVETFLRLMADFGSSWTILYNGPTCGASAPDQFHFQAVPSGRMPIEKEIQNKNRLALVAQKDGVIFYRARDVGREVIILEGDNPAAVGSAFTSFLHALSKVLCVGEEPMINVAGSYEQTTWRLVVFPRRKHRPDAFFREGDARIAVSPAVIEMGGVLVTPFARDFERLDTAAVESIYEEVSLEAKSVKSAINTIGQTG
jgi:hypothetical protein